MGDLEPEALSRLYTAMLADPRWRDDPVIRERAARLGTPPPAPAAPADPARAALARARALAGEGRHADAIAVLQDAVRTGPYD
jgi:hypothetical protein